MIVPNPNYRFNHRRAIFLSGSMDQAMLDRLTPHIIALVSDSRDPISVFIDSPGGNPAVGEVLSRLLRSRGQEDQDPCRIITVVTGQASSAAADFLSEGDYAIAFAESRVYYHGTRQSRSDPLTLEKASWLIENLRSENNRYALELAQRCQNRFFYQYLSHQQNFSNVRAQNANRRLTDVDCLAVSIGSGVSEAAQRVLVSAVKKNQRYQALSAAVFKRTSRSKPISGRKRWAETEAEIINRIVQFELRTNSHLNWTFRHSGLSSMYEDFLLFDDFLGHEGTDRISAIFDRWGDLLLTESDLERIRTASPESQTSLKVQVLQPIVSPIWLFFVAICQALQEGENDLSAVDAFRLGLIDEVLGSDQSMFPIRLFVEFTPETQGAGTA